MKSTSKMFQALFGAGLSLLLIFTLVGQAVAQTCVPPSAGLVSWWPGDGNANDIQDGNDGTLFNGATFALGRVGQAFSFDGVDDYVEVADSTNLDLGVFTAETWIKTTSTFSVGGFRTMFVKGIAFNENYGAYLHTPTGKIRFQFTSAGPYHFFDSGASVNDGIWHHVAVLYDGSQMRMYIDGVLDSSFVPTGMPDTNTHALTFGQRSDPSQALYRWDGLIDELAIYNSALSAAEIQAIFNAGSAGKCKGVILTQTLIATVVDLNLQQGISNALDAKLAAIVLVLDDLNTNNDAAAINMLNAFIQNVEAQRAKKLTDTQADELRDAAQAIIDALSG